MVTRTGHLGRLTTRAGLQQDRRERVDLAQADASVGGPGGRVEVVDVERDVGRDVTLHQPHDAGECWCRDASTTVVGVHPDALQLADAVGGGADLRLEEHLAVLDDRERPAPGDELRHPGPVARAASRLGVDADLLAEHRHGRRVQHVDLVDHDAAQPRVRRDRRLVVDGEERLVGPHRPRGTPVLLEPRPQPHDGGLAADERRAASHAGRDTGEEQLTREPVDGVGVGLHGHEVGAAVAGGDEPAVAEAAEHRAAEHEAAQTGLGDAVGELKVVNAANTEHLDEYKAFLYNRLQRKGMDQHDIHRLAARDRHVFSALMLAHGHGDALITGATRKSAHVLELINHVFDADAAHGAAGVTALIHKGRIILVSDTLVHEWPDEEDLANIAERCAEVARDLGLEPRVAFVSFSTFGYPVSERAEKMHVAPKVLAQRGVDFEFDGEMTVDVALNARARENYPFAKLTDNANILVVPARHSASISVKMMQELAGATVIGPILSGVDKPIQICSTGSTVNDILNMALLAASKVS